MKAIVIIIFSILSTSVFAGDLYLVCENENNEDFLSASIDDHGATMLLNITESQPVKLSAKSKRNEDRSQYLLEIDFLREKIKEEFELELFEEIKVGDYTCLVRD